MSHAPNQSESKAKAEHGLGIADLCISRPVFATMVNLLLVVLGWFSFRSIGVDQFPNVDLPIVTVATTLRGASPEEVETSVTKPLEEIINTVQGIDELSSTSLEGISFITVQFLLERNRDIAALLVTPITYSIFDDWGAGRFWVRSTKRAEPVPQPEPEPVVAK